MNGCGQCPQEVHVREILIVIISTNNIDVTQSDKQGNTNNTISINNTDNMGTSTTCGSGKKYKNCCGKNA